VLFALEAQYLIDRLDGDPDQTPDVPDSCVVLTQRYEFYKEGLRSLEPFGLFPSAQFRPLVSYSYFTDSGPTLKSLSTAQRLALNANSVLKDNTLLKYPINDTLLTCDPQLNFACLPNNPPSFLGIVGGSNPLQTEFYAPIIRNGAMNKFQNGAAIFGSTIADNAHFNATPNGNKDAPIDEPHFTAFGCPVCVHFHWRWSSAIPSSPYNPVNLLAQFDPTFDSNKGQPKLPPGTNQDVDVAFLKSGDHSEEHPSNLFNLYQPQAAILPSVLAADPTGPKQPVFWYVGTGHQNSDQFFIHGGGFGTFYANRVTVQNPSTLSINVEHTRDIHYDIQVLRNDVLTADIPPVISPVPLTSTSPSSGILPAGTDDLMLTFSDVFFHSQNVIAGIDVIVTLYDGTLDSTYLGNPTKPTWQRVFRFNVPSTVEP